MLNSNFFSIAVVAITTFNMEKIENIISTKIISTCFKIHNNIGPGLLESVYEEILCYELSRYKLFIERQKPIPLLYEATKLKLSFRADIIVEKKVIVEVKAIEAIAPIHKMQLLTYLRITNLKLGLLVNFNTLTLAENIKRVANNL